MTLLAIDYGTHKSGLAYSVESFAFGYKTVPTNILISTLHELIEEKKVEAIVIGMPYNIDGTMSSHGKRVLKFIKILKQEFPLPVYTQDERLTTSEARIGFSEYGINGDIDVESARMILSDYLASI